MARQNKPPATPGQRQLRVGEEIRHVLSDMFTRGEVHDSALMGRVITVSEVRMSPDLRHATCFVMPLGGEKLDEVITGLERAAPYLRGEVARRVRLRFAPELNFKADHGFDHAQRISVLLNEADGA